MIFYLAALQAIPPSLGEAAALEGASRWTYFRRVQFPLLMPTTLFVLVNAVINAFRMVDHIVVMTQRRPRQRDHAPAVLHLRRRLQFLGHDLRGGADHDPARAARARGGDRNTAGSSGGSIIDEAFRVEPRPLRPRRRLTPRVSAASRAACSRTRRSSRPGIAARPRRAGSLGEDLGGIILGILDRAVTEPLGAGLVPVAARIVGHPPHRHVADPRRLDAAHDQPHEVVVTEPCAEMAELASASPARCRSAAKCLRCRACPSTSAPSLRPRPC